MNVTDSKPAITWRPELSDTDEPATPAVPVKLLLGVGALFFGFVPLSLVLHQSVIGPGARSYVPGFSLRLAFYFVSLTALVHMVLVRPLVNMVYPQIVQKTIPALRVLIVTLMLSVPLLSFAYYLSAVKTLMDLNEIFLAVVPATIVAALIFEFTRHAVATSVFLAGALFIPLFVMNDLLAPFNVVWNYISTNRWFYIWRALFPVAAVWLAVFKIAGEIGRSQTVAERLRNWMIGQWAVVLYSLVAVWLLPLGIALGESHGHVAAAVLSPREYWWVFPAVALSCLMVRSRAGYRLALGFSAAALVTSAIQVALFFSRFEMDLLRLFGLAQHATVVVTYTWFIVEFLKPAYRERFRRA